MDREVRRNSPNGAVEMWPTTPSLDRTTSVQTPFLRWWPSSKRKAERFLGISIGCARIIGTQLDLSLTSQHGAGVSGRGPGQTAARSGEARGAVEAGAPKTSFRWAELGPRLRRARRGNRAVV